MDPEKQILGKHAKKIGVNIHGLTKKYVISPAQMQYLLAIKRKEGFEIEFYKIIKPQVIDRYKKKSVLKIISYICKLLGHDKLWNSIKKPFINFLIFNIDEFDKEDYARIVFTLKSKNMQELRALMFGIGKDEDEENEIVQDIVQPSPVKDISQFLITEDEEKLFYYKISKLKNQNIPILYNKSIEIYKFYISCKNYIQLYSEKKEYNSERYKFFSEFVNDNKDLLVDFGDLVDTKKFGNFILKVGPSYFNCLREMSETGLDIIEYQSETEILYFSRPKVLNYITKVVERRVWLTRLVVKEKDIKSLIESLTEKIDEYSSQYNKILSSYFESVNKKPTKKENIKEKNKKETFLYEKLLPLYQTIGLKIKKNWKLLKTGLQEKGIDIFSLSDVQKESNQIPELDLTPLKFVQIFKDLSVGQEDRKLLDNSKILPKENEIITFKVLYDSVKLEGVCTIIPETDSIGFLLERVHPSGAITLFLNDFEEETEIVNVKGKSFIKMQQLFLPVVIVVKTAPTDLMIVESGISITNTNFFVGEQVFCSIGETTFVNTIQEINSNKLFPISWQKDKIPDIQTVNIFKYVNTFDKITVKNGKLFSTIFNQEFTEGKIQFYIARQIETSGIVTKIDNDFIYTTIPPDLILSDVIEFTIEGVRRKSRVRGGKILLAVPSAGDKVIYISEGKPKKGVILGYKGHKFLLSKNEEIGFFDIIKVYKKQPTTFFTQTLDFDDVLSLEVDNYLRDIIINTTTRKLDAILNNLNEEYKKSFFLNFKFDILLKKETDFVDFVQKITKVKLLSQRADFAALYNSLDRLPKVKLLKAELEETNRLWEIELQEEEENIKQSEGKIKENKEKLLKAVQKQFPRLKISEGESEFAHLKDFEIDFGDDISKTLERKFEIEAQLESLYLGKTDLQPFLDAFEEKLEIEWKKYLEIMSPETLIVLLKEEIPNFFHIHPIELIELVKQTVMRLNLEKTKMADLGNQKLFSVKYIKLSMFFQLENFLLNVPNILNFDYKTMSEVFIQFIYDFIRKNSTDFEQFKQYLIFQIVKEYIQSFEYKVDRATVLTEAKELYTDYKNQLDIKRQQFDSLQEKYKIYENEIQSSFFDHVVQFEQQVYDSIGEKKSIREYLTAIVPILIYIDQKLQKDKEIVQQIKEKKFSLFSIGEPSVDKKLQRDEIFSIVDRYAYGRFQNVFRIDFTKEKRKIE
jgi:hypothetical protein